MHYLILSFLICLIIAALIWAVVGIIGLKNRFLQKIISKKIMDKGIFSTLAVRQVSAYILKQPKPDRQELLKNISEGDFLSLFENVSSLSLQAKIGLMTGKVVAENPEDSLYNLMVIDYKIKQQDFDTAVLLLSRINDQKLSKAERAYKSLQMAKIALFEADFQNATDEISHAIKVFKKENMLFEEAQSYFLLGTIYRVSGIFDTADFMLRPALKLFHFIGSLKQEAEVLGTLGLLMSVQKRFQEASDYFIQSEALFKKAKDKTGTLFIICQQAMLALLQNDLKTAKKMTDYILNNQDNDAVLAFASDIQGRIFAAQKKWPQAVKALSAAAEIYFRQKNFAAAFECLYMRAEILVEQNKLDDAELVLRDIIQKEQHHKSCFHVASAHTLLGLIFLQKKDLERAKSIFNQALSYELHNDRAVGAAVDYANLAVVERRCGNTEAACKNLEMALLYAKDSDEELYNQIKSALD